jgi:hypothetical protein
MSAGIVVIARALRTVAKREAKFALSGKSAALSDSRFRASAQKKRFGIGAPYPRPSWLNA